MRLHDALCRHIASVGRDGRRAGMADGRGWLMGGDGWRAGMADGWVGGWLTCGCGDGWRVGGKHKRWLIAKNTHILWKNVKRS